MRSFLLYLKRWQKNVVPVIPPGAEISPNSKIKPGSAGKVPGLPGADGWHGLNWVSYSMTERGARIADKAGATVGFRAGRTFNNVLGFDLDVTHAEDAKTALAILTEVFGFEPPVRRVDHPEHHKLLAMVIVSGEPPRNVDMAFKQSDGADGLFQLLSTGRYFNVEGQHPRGAPYVWSVDILTDEVPVVTAEKALEAWEALRVAFKCGPKVNARGRNESNVKPEQVDEKTAEWLLGMIPNDDAFRPYDAFIQMAAALKGASGGAPWGLRLWLDWCDQIDQGDLHKPWALWDSLADVRMGAQHLRRWAQERQPSTMAKADFEDAPLDPEDATVADNDAEAADAFLNEWCLAGSGEFYRLATMTPFNAHGFEARFDSEAERKIRRHLGNRKATLARLFSLHSTQIADVAAHLPGAERFVERNGVYCLNTWRAPPRPLKDALLDMDAVERYLAHCRLVLGPDNAALWLRWHAFMLQHPGKPPGWGFLVQGPQGLGKDLMVRPFTEAHGENYQQITPEILDSGFTGFAAKRLLLMTELPARLSGSIYTTLKALTAGNKDTVVTRKGRESVMAPNCLGLVLFTNEAEPLRIAADDRRFLVVNNLAGVKATPDYYRRLAPFIDEQWPTIAEYAYRLPLDDEDIAALLGSAPATEGKALLARPPWAEEYLAIVEELESDDPTDRYLPLGTTTEVIKWLTDRRLKQGEIPSSRGLGAELYDLGARPVVPDPKKAKQALPVQGRRLWLFASTWRDKAARWDLAGMLARREVARLAGLYFDHVVRGAEFKAVDPDEDAV